MNVLSFGDIPAGFSGRRKAAAAVIPVPFEKSTSWMKGSSGGPQAILNASSHIELYDIPTGTEVFRKGIYTAPEICADTAEEMILKVARETSELASEGKFIAVLGGEHTVSAGVARGLKEAYGEFSILHLDAHSDRRDEFEGDRYSHACAVARMNEYSSDIVSVGIRSMDSSELKYMDREKVYFARDLRRSSDWINEVIDKLGEKVFLNIDLDVLDPSEMPSTGTPEPGGLSWYDITDLAEALTASRNLIAVDAVELMPVDCNPAPDFLAAKLIYRIISLKLA